MSVRGRQPGFEVLADGLSVTYLNDMEIFWSKSPRSDAVVAAFRTPNRGLVVRKSTFGGSKVKEHLSILDGSTREAVQQRLDSERFFLYYEHEWSLRTTDYEDSGE